ncbi:ABC transporter permease [Ruminococcaceae bacterium OttesenSCG-928-I18]|nr:ABC transporter permease [Ruminococcaceae bacterium OttesenSCG-928-I18]
MRQLGIVFRFELLGYLKRKSFIILTLALVLIVAVVLTWPRISAMLGIGQGAETPDEPERIALSSKVGDARQAADLFTQAFEGQNYLFEPLEATLPELEGLVENEEYDSAVQLTGPLSYTRVVRSIGMYDSFDEAFSEMLLSQFQAATMAEYGVPAEEIEQTLAAQTEVETVTVGSGKDQFRNFIYTYILVFLLYFAILMYGQFVASSVATEKSTRAMELLITSARPNSLMFGKVLGAGCAGLLQLVLILGTAFLFYNLNHTYYQDNYIVQSIFGIPAEMLLYTFLFFILGFFIYAFLYAGLASLVSRMEDLSTAIMPITYLFIIAFIVVMFSMGSGNVDNLAMVICSYVPLTSPMAMFTRIAMGDVAGWKIALSVVILLLSTIGAGVLSANIYRLGVLLYGNPPKPKEILRLLKSNK